MRPRMRTAYCSSYYYYSFLLLLLILWIQQPFIHGETIQQEGQEASCSSGSSSSSASDDDSMTQHCSSTSSSTEDNNGSVYSSGVVKDNTDHLPPQPEDEEEEEDELIRIHYSLYGRPQKIIKPRPNEIYPHDIQEVIDDMEQYMSYVWSAGNIKYEKIRFYCRNHHSMCSVWAAQGECYYSLEEMVEFCSPVCQTCDVLEQEFGKHLYSSAATEKDKDKSTTVTSLPKDNNQDEDNNNDEDEDDYDDFHEENGQRFLIHWGVPQNLGTEHPEKVQEFIEQTSFEYMTMLVYQEALYQNVWDKCENRHPNCSIWAVNGECNNSPEYMHLHCAPACQSCMEVDYSTRCPLEEDAPNALPNPGDLNALFERIIQDSYWKVNHGPLTIISQPKAKTTKQDSDDSVNGPWIITLDNFLTEEECQRLIEIGHAEGYELSTDISDDMDEFGSFIDVESEERTSTTSWCPDECYDDDIVGPVHKRIEQLLGIPYVHWEYMQLLKYEQDQFYGEHHDYVDIEWDRPQGPRILTVFLYLNTVEQGGGTHFSTLNVTVQPKQGRAVLWPSVIDEDPTSWDERTMHEALPVIQGQKYGANVWIHLRDWKVQYDKNCV